MCTVFQLKIEQDYWNYIANWTSMPEMNWLSEISKDVTKQNSINWDHTKTKINIQHRQQIIEHKLRQAERHLNIHLQQPYPFYWQSPNNHCMEQCINIISNALVIVVENSLYYFRTNFEQKKILLYYDMNDAFLVKSFYDLNPTEEQVFILHISEFSYTVILFLNPRFQLFKRFGELTINFVNKPFVKKRRINH
jgi:hypothetical protein